LKATGKKTIILVVNNTESVAHS